MAATYEKIPESDATVGDIVHFLWDTRIGNDIITKGTKLVITKDCGVSLDAEGSGHRITLSRRGRASFPIEYQRIVRAHTSATEVEEADQYHPIAMYDATVNDFIRFCRRARFYKGAICGEGTLYRITGLSGKVNPPDDDDEFCAIKVGDTGKEGPDEVMFQRNCFAYQQGDYEYVRKIVTKLSETDLTKDGPKCMHCYVFHSMEKGCRCG